MIKKRQVATHNIDNIIWDWKLRVADQIKRNVLPTKIWKETSSRRKHRFKQKLTLIRTSMESKRDILSMQILPNKCHFQEGKMLQFRLQVAQDLFKLGTWCGIIDRR